MGFECEFCGKKFENKEGLKVHKGKKHSKAVETEIDKMLEYVKGEGQVSLGKLSKELDIDKEKVEEWAKTLDKYGLARLVFPENPLRSPYLEVKKDEE